MFSAVGSQAALVAIPYQVFVLTRSPALVGLLGIVELAPLVAGSLLGGGAGGRLGPRTASTAAPSCAARRSPSVWRRPAWPPGRSSARPRSRSSSCSPACWRER